MKGVFGLSDTDARSRMAVAPVIGINDTSTEGSGGPTGQLTAFMQQQDRLAWWSLWSLTRDQPLPRRPC